MKKFYCLLSIIVILFSALPAQAQVFTDSLILDMPMNGDATDRSGNGNNGTGYNVVADTNRMGTTNSSYRFNGVDSYIEIPASPSMNKIQTANEITITTWINIRQWHDNWNVFGILERYNQTTDGGWGLEANWAAGGMLFLADETNTANRADCSFTWNFNQWYHVGFTYSQAQGRAKFYVDGVNVCDTPYTANINIADTTAPFAIGRSLAGPDEFSDGLIDDFKIYYRVLSPSEIDTVFTVGVKEYLSERVLSIYPNPATGRLTVAAKGNNPIQNISIQNMLGENVYTSSANGSSTTIDISNFSKGMYFVTLQIRNERVTRKFLKL